MSTRSAKSSSMQPTASSNWMLLHHGLVGAVLGFSLAILLSGLLVYYPTAGDTDPAKDQIVMWAVCPIWIALICLSFLAPTKKILWQWLVLANLVAAIGIYLVVYAGRAAS
ncbi:hypothetical protein [Pollutimonas bauzanensis]|uniref:hypothetical protein n=1 Tax=Pollutimonas bauzanensis TaxID=658167 RepID=UPI00333F8064